jgi:ketol-acid reductoisomerase
VKVYYDEDIDPSKLKKKKIAIIGYGSQGHAHAQNLRDSGVSVTVADIKDSANWKKAKEAGFNVKSVSAASKSADIVVLLAPDTCQPAIYHEHVEKNLVAGNALMFSHGFNIHYGQIKPPAGVDVFMVAPKAPGHTVRDQYVGGAGVPGLVAVHQNPTGNAKDLALAYARAIGCSRAGVIETTFKDETETDLFGEQSVLCGGLTALILAGYETLVEAGYPPEMAYFECCHEVKLIVDLIYEGGIANMRYSVSDTAKYGDITRGPRLINDSVKQEMKKIIGEIQSGEFATEWILENQAGRPTYNALLRQGEEHPIESVGAELRGMMSSLFQKRLVDKDKN